MLLTTSEAPTDGLLAALTVYLCFLGLVRIATRVTGPGRSIALFSAWLALTAAAAFRHVEPTLGGRDAFIYRLVFESSQGAEGEPISVTGTGAASEPLYIGLVRLLRLFTDDYHVYFFVVYGIISFGIVYFISKTLEARHSVLPLILIFPAWLHSFNIMRNWIAIAFFLVALTFLIRGRRPAYYALVLVATGFHPLGRGYAPVSLGGRSPIRAPTTAMDTHRYHRYERSTISCFGLRQQDCRGNQIRGIP